MPTSAEKTKSKPNLPATSGQACHIESANNSNSNNSAKPDDLAEKSPNSKVDDEMKEKLLKKLTNAMLISNPERYGSHVKKECKNDYKFWRTQPVPDMNETVGDNCAITPDQPRNEIRVEPYSLPSGFSWCEISLNTEDELQEVYDLLCENYVEDDDHLFRFEYSKQFIKWALQPPGWHPDWHVGIRTEKSHKLVGFIGAMPCELQIYDACKKLVEINYLCVHKRLRSKRMAPVLIREITRRVHLRGLFQALFTSGAMLPRPVVTCRYWHRPLNPRMLIECKFSHLSHNMTLQRTIKLYRLPDTTSVSGFRQMTKADVPKAWAVLNKYIQQFSLHQKFTEDEFRHFFLPRENVVNSFVVQNAQNEITDFCSYYVLPSSIMNNTQHSTLRAAYSFFNASTVTPWPALIQDMLVMAKKLGFDVFNALDLMENKSFLEQLKFGMGDGNLHYYFYNWQCPVATPDKTALVLQ